MYMSVYEFQVMLNVEELIDSLYTKKDEVSVKCVYTKVLLAF